MSTSQKNLSHKNKMTLIPEGKERVRAVKAVVMRWITNAVLVDDILVVRPRTVQEWAAQRFFVNCNEAKPGSRNAIVAAEALRKLIDGLEEGEAGQIMPVTLIDRIIHDNLNGGVTREQEIHQTVQLTLPEKQHDVNEVSPEFVDTEETSNG
jgi:Asp-tRNA(Asn)/Glu-tRNA(Gln) amidotransferase B subunit